MKEILPYGQKSFLMLYYRAKASKVLKLKDLCYGFIIPPQWFYYTSDMVLLYPLNGSIIPLLWFYYTPSVVLFYPLHVSVAPAWFK